MHTLTVDLGGTTIKAGLVHTGQVLAMGTISACAADGLGSRLDDLARLLHQLCQQANLTPRDCRGLGMAFPGVIDYAAMRVVGAGRDKYDDAMQLDLVGWARQALGLNLALENDAHAALLGEWRCGAGQGASSMVMMTLGTGVGTSVLIAGKPLRGRHGIAGLMGGHVVLNLQGRPCICPNHGCVEAEASGWALPLMIREDAGYAQSALAREPALNYEAVFRLADAGDAVATRVRDRSLHVWSEAAVSMVNLFDPERIVIGGGIMQSAAPVLAAVSKRVNESRWVADEPILVCRAASLDQAALLGMNILLTETVEFI